jgi:Fe2+ transport system protein B
MKACTNRYSINEEKLEKMLMVYVREAVAETIAEVERIEHERKLKPKKKNNRAAIEKQLEKLEDVYIDSPTMTKEKYEKRKAAILAKLVEDEPEEKLPELADLEKVRAIFESNIEEIYETFTGEERREFWRSILDHIVIEGKEIKSVGFLE